MIKTNETKQNKTDKPEKKDRDRTGLYLSELSDLCESCELIRKNWREINELPTFIHFILIWWRLELQIKWVRATMINESERGSR